MRPAPEDVNNYNGPSMNPFLKAGDGLIVRPYGNKRIACGDIITFRRKGGEINIAHRVVRVDGSGVRTRGDNNAVVDPWILDPGDIAGRVVSLRRKSGVFPVAGGVRGRIYGLFIRQYNAAVRKASVVLHPLYRFVSSTGIMRGLFPLTQARMFSFTRPHGVELQLVLGRWIIARRTAGRAQWQIRRPFRLFINEEDLDREDIWRQRTTAGPLPTGH